MPVAQGKFHKWYNSTPWRKRRANQLALYPLCKVCLERNALTPARVADHVIPHQGNYNSFLLGELQSLCFSCHNVRKRLVDLHGFSSDVDEMGWPIDPAHPTNVRIKSKQNSIKATKNTAIPYGTMEPLRRKENTIPRRGRIFPGRGGS
jgi:5-methylcytosine-specific restriction enzyme A